MCLNTAEPRVPTYECDSNGPNWILKNITNANDESIVCELTTTETQSAAAVCEDGHRLIANGQCARALPAPTVECGSEMPFRLTILWNEVIGASSYRVRLAEGQTHTVEGGSVTSYTIYYLDPNSAYILEVWASDGVVDGFSTMLACDTATNSAPSFDSDDSVMYPVEQLENTLQLPVATGGNGELVYGLDATLLPRGLDFDADVRRLSGIPTQAGTFNVEYHVADTDSDTLAEDGDVINLRILVEKNAVPSFGTVSLPDVAYVEGLAIAATQFPAATGGDGTLRYRLRSSSLPPGLAFDRATRILSGVPIALGMFDVTYRVVDSDFVFLSEDEDSLSFRIMVETNTAPSFGSVSVRDFVYVADEPIATSQLPDATGGNGTLVYSMDAELLPSGLVFDPATRALSGTPSVPGVYNVVYRVTDSDSETSAKDGDTLSFAITVSAAPPVHESRDVSVVVRRDPDPGDTSTTKQELKNELAQFDWQIRVSPQADAPDGCTAATWQTAEAITLPSGDKTWPSSILALVIAVDTVDCMYDVTDVVIPANAAYVSLHDSTGDDATPPIGVKEHGGWGWEANYYITVRPVL